MLATDTGEEERHVLSRLFERVHKVGNITLTALFALTIVGTMGSGIVGELRQLLEGLSTTELTLHGEGEHALVALNDLLEAAGAAAPEHLALLGGLGVQEVLAAGAEHHAGDGILLDGFLLLSHSCECFRSGIDTN